MLQLGIRLIRSVYVHWQGAPALIVPKPAPSPHAALDCARLCYSFAQRHFLADREPVLIQRLPDEGLCYPHGLPSFIQFLTIAMPSIRASWGVMKVRLQVYLVNSSLLRSTQCISEKNVQALPG